MYPGRPFTPRQHRFGLDDGYRLHYLNDEGEWDSGHPTSYAEWLLIAINNKLDVRIESVLGFRWLPDAVRDPQAVVYASQSKADHHARIVSIVWRIGNKWASLFGADSWGDGATHDSVSTHWNVCQWLGAGVHASPSGLGQATIRSKLPRWHTTLGSAESRDLLNNIVGGRAELDSADWYPIAYEIDRRMAYVAECLNPLPIGAATWIGPVGLERANTYPHWFGRCAVIVPRPLIRGPFPFRTSSGLLSYPIDPGQYTAWLWKDEAMDCQHAGCYVFPEMAWAWTRSEAVLAPWAEWIYERRMNAPDERIADLVKRVAVAAIGWFAMQPYRLTVKLDDGKSPDYRIIVNASDLPTAYVAETVPDERPITMPHWASFIWMQARRSLYAREMAEIGSGNTLLGSNFDSIRLASPTRLPTSTELGQWREQVLTNVQSSANRHTTSDQYTKRPGVKRANQ